jgi:transposase-like protein
MGPFPNSEGYEYILVAVDYVSKLVEALPCRAANAMHSKKMFHEVIFLRYGVPRIVISDGGPHFIDQTFQKALSEVGVDHMGFHSISPSDERSSRNIKQANQEYHSEDSESNGQKLEEEAQRSSMGIPNGLQNADRHDTLSSSVQEDLSPFRRT